MTKASQGERGRPSEQREVSPCPPSSQHSPLTLLRKSLSLASWRRERMLRSSRVRSSLCRTMPSGWVDLPGGGRGRAARLINAHGHMRTLQERIHPRMQACITCRCGEAEAVAQLRWQHLGIQSVSRSVRATAVSTLACCHALAAVAVCL
jgi:hypothetical protein